MPRRTPLYDAHRRLGARLVDFAGWEMPVAYDDAADEHRAVRTCCGLFDVSHMGELRVHGRDAGRVWQRLTTNDVCRLGDGDAQYTICCGEAGGVLDDLVLYRFAEDDYLAVVNASNTGTMRAWVEERCSGHAAFADESADWALLAVQGPRAVDVMRAVGPVDPSQRSFTVRRGEIAGIAVWLSRTGYTGEDGFEVLVPSAGAPSVWSAVLDEVCAAGGRPAGLAARDTLRLEAALPLCGSDMGPDTTPLQAGLGWVVRFEDGNDFIGRPALEVERAAGPARRLVCFELEGAGVPRHGYEVRHDDVRVGLVTSGARSPTLGRFIGMAYVPAPCASPGTEIAVVVRGRSVPGRVVRRPFYRREA
jgi:aminomethyltransferase